MVDTFDSLDEVERQRAKELIRIEKEKDDQKIRDVITKTAIEIIIESFGVDVILDQIGFETCKDYFKIELGLD